MCFPLKGLYSLAVLKFIDSISIISLCVIKADTQNPSLTHGEGSCKREGSLMKFGKTRKLVICALLLAITLILGLSPIGYINIGIVEITLLHIPTIIAAILFGVKGGILFGFFFGVTSLIRAFMVPTPFSIALLGTETGITWYNIFLIFAIIFVPRILVGIFSALTFGGLQKAFNRPAVSAGAAGLVGSLTNTVFFLGFTYIFAAQILAEAFGTTASGVATMLFTATGLLNGGIEAFVALIVCAALSAVLLRIIASITPASNSQDKVS